MVQRYSHLFYGQVMMASPNDDDIFGLVEEDYLFYVVDTEGDIVGARKRSLELLPEETRTPESHSSLNQLAEEMHSVAVSKGWFPPGEERNFGETMMLVVSELAEAFEHYRDGHDFQEVWIKESGAPDGIPIEIADAIIRLLDFCADQKIDIDRALHEKAEFNRTRPFRHGGKIC